MITIGSGNLYGRLKFTPESDGTNRTRCPVSDRSDQTTIAKLVSKLDQFAVNGPDFTVINE